MLEQQLYANEKLREIESDRIIRTQLVAEPRAKPMLAPLAGPAGRALHRLGHRLESWASPERNAEAKSGSPIRMR